MKIFFWSINYLYITTRQYNHGADDLIFYIIIILLWNWREKKMQFDWSHSTLDWDQIGIVHLSDEMHSEYNNISWKETFPD